MTTRQIRSTIGGEHTPNPIVGEESRWVSVVKLPSLARMKLAPVPAVSLAPRWLVIAGNRNDPEDVDYVHDQLLVFDRQRGGLCPIKKGPWPAAISGEQAPACTP
jgi:hypothetical protein